ncbi:MAG TPA: NIPSNAP family protein [Puia sp.]|nr:NIPSNAP family protein [Puia sp.]
MKRRKFVQSSLLTASAMVAGKAISQGNKNMDEKRAMIEWREYEMHFGASESELHNYFQNALIPALNKYGVKNVGVFKEWSKSEPVKIYLLAAYPSWDDYLQIISKVRADEAYKASSASYMKLPADKFPFTRYKSKFMTAFEGMPQLVAPAKEPRIFELRTYEGYNEDALARKIKMFNKEEFVIFYRTKLTPVFFGEVIAGDDMPCLTYMVTFTNMEERDRNWSAFGNDPDWKKVSSDPEYANTVSRITKIFLEPVSYSQV